MSLLISSLIACKNLSDSPLLGYWKLDGETFELLHITKNGEGYLLKRYYQRYSDNTPLSVTEFAATIEDNTISIHTQLEVSTGVYNAETKNLTLDGKRKYSHLNDADGNQVLISFEKKLQDKQAKCDILQKEVDAQRNILQGDNWNNYVIALNAKESAKGCDLENTGMQW